MRLALLTMKGASDLARSGEIPLEEGLKERGVEFSWVPWNESVDWSKFDAALIRTTWDYQAHFNDFIEALEGIEKSGCPLLNPLSIIKWNSDKSYLLELEENGIDIVPTRYLTDLSLKDSFAFFQCDEVVVKPTISASAHNTFLVSKNSYHEVEEKISSIDKTFIIQPKIESVLSEGEFSLHYFGGEFSHAVLKKPKEGDFRSQEEYGSFIQKVEPEDCFQQACDKILNNLSDLTYARVDLVRGSKGRPLLMELELIEPCLYLTFDNSATDAFLEAVTKKILKN